MMIATDVYFLQFHSCVVYLRVLCVELCQRLLRNLVLPYLVECCYQSFVVVTCVSCKILEHIICKHMLKHLENHKILTNLNHGFRSGYSFWLGIWHIQEGHLCGIRIEEVPILFLLVRPSLHGHFLSVRLQLLLSFCGFVGMMIATVIF
jgi:hypothetical protein